MTIEQSALDLVAENEELKAQINMFRNSLELHIKVIGDLYPSDKNDIDECHLSEFIAVHHLTDGTKELLNKTPEQYLNSVKADAIEFAAKKHLTKHGTAYSLMMSEAANIEDGVS